MNKDNWLGRSRLDSHQRVEFKIDAGAYAVVVEGCGGDFANQQTILQLLGPTVISIGGAERVPSGYALQQVAVYRPARQAPQPGIGEDQGESEEAPAEGASDDPYAGRTDCVHNGLLEGNGHCCSPVSGTDRNGNRLCGGNR